MASLASMTTRLEKLEAANKAVSDESPTIIVRFVVSPKGQDQGELIGFRVGTKHKRLIAREPGESDTALYDRAVAIAKAETPPRCVAVVYEDRKYREAA